MQLWADSLSDDSGFLGLINPAIYSSFVHEDWELDQLFQHFRTEMSKRTLLLWGTGIEGDLKIRVELGDSNASSAFREISGPIVVTDGGLSLINYESLTMAAQFPNKQLPEKHLEYCRFSLQAGTYNCNIAQMYDPSSSQTRQGDTDFIISLSKTTAACNSWTSIAWSNR
ncbi:MAG: hypothetical protein K2X27_02165 [Candidatus Obscuribacterales bacterium]|nr:hypothetical protein [Candidatus Obscuribacterales bacterium]